MGPGAGRLGVGAVVRQPDVLGTIFLLIAGWSAMVAAVIVLRERRRCALLLYAVGSWWFVRELSSPSVEIPLVFTIGLVLFPVGPALVAHLLLSYPTGRIQGWSYRVIVACGYVVTFGSSAGGTSVFDPAPIGCVGCPDNLLLIHADLGLFDQAQPDRCSARRGVVDSRARSRGVASDLSQTRLARLHQPGRGRRSRLPRGERCVLSDQPVRGSAGAAITGISLFGRLRGHVSSCSPPL